ncbi:MAG: histidine kinase [Bacteroidota bacterium]
MNDSEIIKVIVYTFLAFMLMALVLILFFYFSRKKIMKQQLEKKNLELNYQKDLLSAVIITQEEERKRIAQDLHDDISSKLNIVSLNSHMLNAPDLTKAETNEITENIISLTTKALENSRRIAHDLLPPVLEKFGLNAGIAELALEFNSSKSVNVNYESHVNFETVDRQKHLHIFRVLQELMNNSLRHGKATEIVIIFEVVKGVNTCSYSDNGLGFDVDDKKNQKGLGMKNIEGRINFIKGAMKITSHLNKGTQIVFTF